jgi:periplasmic protein CpxP/Spy
MIFKRKYTMTFMIKRPFAVAALAGSLLLAAAPIAARADVATPKTQHQMKGETVDQRIADLHKSLGITADEETNWAAVAQVMRDNDAALAVLVAARTAENRQKVSAVEDLNIYEKFAQAHVDGLKTLISSFQTLYAAMPDAQKAVADGVFQSVGKKTKTAAH